MSILKMFLTQYRGRAADFRQGLSNASPPRSRFVLTLIKVLNQVMSTFTLCAPPPPWPLPRFLEKCLHPTEASAQLARLERPWVFTNGCFDLLHAGHVTYLAQARALGATLIVALNSDTSIQGLGKGSSRPIVPLNQRMTVVAALESVSVVCYFEEETPLSLILQLKPEVLVKGGDWQPTEVVGAEQVRSWGGSVHCIPFEHDVSTSTLVSRIQQADQPPGLA